MRLSGAALAAAAVALSIEASPSLASGRVVAIGAPVVDSVYALGAGGDVVAVDRTAETPPGSAPVARVGYLRNLGAEGLLSLSPTLVLATDEAGPAAVLDQVRAAGVRCEVVSPAPARGAAPHDAAREAAASIVKRVASVVGAEDRAPGVLASLDADLEEARRTVAARAKRLVALFVVHPPRSGAPLVGGSGTPAAALLELAGADNAARVLDGYRPLTPEAAATSGVEVVVVPAGTVAASGGAAALLAAAGLSSTPAGRAARVVEVDAWMLGYGPRTGRAALELARRLDADQPASAPGKATR